MKARYDEIGCWSRYTQHMQDGCYQFLAASYLWDCIISGFKPGRQFAIDALNIQPEDKILFIGEGAGADFECLPAHANKGTLKAFDFSSQMVHKAKAKARELGIPEENVFEGDAQALPFIEEKFDKIFFPLSLGSIPNPQLALQEAERVLAEGGQIAVFEKMVDDGNTPSYARRCAGFFARCTFADINRNLTEMMGEESPLKITQYQSMGGRLNGCFASSVGSLYRVAILVRDQDYTATPSVPAMIR